MPKLTIEDVRAALAKLHEQGARRPYHGIVTEPIFSMGVECGAWSERDVTRRKDGFVWLRLPYETLTSSASPSTSTPE